MTNLRLLGYQSINGHMYKINLCRVTVHESKFILKGIVLHNIYTLYMVLSGEEKEEIPQFQWTKNYHVIFSENCSSTSW